MAYQKQVWENLPSTNTPITADRLNHMEDGIYEASTGTSIEVHNNYNTSTTEPYSANYVNNIVSDLKEIILFEGEATNNCTISDTYTNYSRIDMYTNVGFTSFLPNKSNSCVISRFAYTDQLYQEYQQFNFNGTSVTKQYSGNYYSGANHNTNATIYKIVGYL